jgi:hypothetical protein
MRQAVVVAGTLAGAAVLVQFLDRDPIPPAGVPILWTAVALVLAVELVGMGTLRRFATERPRTTVGALSLAVIGLVALGAARTPRLSALPSDPSPSVPWANVQSTLPTLPLVPAARELLLALRAGSNQQDLTGCETLLRPGDSLSPRFLMPVGELISSSRVLTTPAVGRVQNAVRAMEQVPAFRQVNRTPPASSQEQTLVQIYDWILGRGWILARKRDVPAGAAPGPEPSMCAYGLSDLSLKPALGQYETILRSIPAS